MRYLPLIVILGLPSAALAQGPTLGKPLFKRPLLGDRSEYEVDITGKETQKRLEMQLGKAPLVIPGFAPHALGKTLVYRSYLDLRAVPLALTDGVGVGEILWKTVNLEGSLVHLFESEGFARPLDARAVAAWIERHPEDGRSWALLENTLLGAASSDGERVFVIDDLAAPFPPPDFLPFAWPKASFELKPLIQRNYLFGFNVSNGAARIQTFGHREARNGHCLGAPLPLKGSLFALYETTGEKFNPTGPAEMHLLRLDAKDGKEQRPPFLLDKVPESMRFTHDLRRRTAAVPLVEDKGVLFCPGFAGKVFAVDLDKDRVLWTYTYREEDKDKKAAKPMPFGMPTAVTLPARAWRVPVFLRQGDQLILAAPDHHAVHCIDSKTGKPRWTSTPDKSDVYVAGVVGDLVLIVGASQCRALGLTDGKEKWRLKTGVPSGRAAFHDGLCFVPMASGPDGQGPHLCVVDPAKGTVRGRVAAPKGESLGNLLIHDDLLVSQTVLHITAFPRPVVPAK